MVSIDSPIPIWIYRWLAISAFICIIDGSFCVLRPHSMPGGCLATLFYPYKWYIIADKNYANVKDVFIWTQGFGNLIESALNLLVVFNFFKNVRNAKMAAIIASVMTLWKTVLFSLYSLEIPTGHVVEHWWGEVMVYGMGAFWIVIPALTIRELARHFICGSGIPSRGMKRSVMVTSSVDPPNNVVGSSSDEEDEDEVDSPSVKTTPNTRRRYNLRQR